MAFQFGGRPVTIERIRNSAKARLNRLRWRMPSHHVRSAYGPRLTKRPNDLTFRFSVTGTYGKLIPDVLDGIGERFVFLDIGANAGIFSLVAASKGLCEKVVSIEPVPRTFATLVENIALNEAWKIVPLCGAISDMNTPLVALTYNARHSGASQISDRSSAATVVAPVLPLALLDAVLGGNGRVIVKIDVEGHEVNVLKALNGAGFFARVTDVIIEVSAFTGGGADHAAATKNVLQSMGFAERTTPKQGSKVHYDAHFVRKAVGPT